MTGKPDDDSADTPLTETFASPACSMHELDPPCTGDVPDPQTTIDVTRWRKAQRERLIAARLALSVGEREENAKAIARQLDEILTLDDEAVVSLYWPFRAEPDLRFWMLALHEKGVRVALPAVIKKDGPLQFRQWTPETKMERGLWNILTPPSGTEIAPTITIAPLVGFDETCYRLGYGGGYYDRTLAAMTKRPLTIGVCHPKGRLSTVFPQPHDIPMDWIVTGEGQPLRQAASKA